MSQPHDPKAASQARFGRYAQQYVTSQVHATGDDLERLLALAAPQRHMRALDVATGGGHTALRFAPHVRQVVASDLTLPMLEQARAFIAPRAGSVAYAQADAERLPFASGAFDLVTCRIAAHHFPDPWRFVQQAARVLTSGGLLLVQDMTVHPDDARAARYADAFERLRDPSHVRMYADYEWQGMFLDAGLRVEACETMRRPASMEAWARLQGADDDVLERLHLLMIQAPEAVARFHGFRHAGTPAAAFDHVYVIVAGRKP
jgi:ubiquinone/menaquinone biosynthesis C-methylase UbiE